MDRVIRPLKALKCTYNYPDGSLETHYEIDGIRMTRDAMLSAGYGPLFGERPEPPPPSEFERKVIELLERQVELLEWIHGLLPGR